MKRLFAMGNIRGFFAVVLSALVSIGLSQNQGGGSGGFGGGGFGGGGMGGGGFGNSDGDQDMSMRRAIFPGKKNESGELSSWASKSIILTPGDKVEWKFSAKPGQVIFATAESDTFDPAIAVVDSDGKVLTENDDQYEGEQSPYVSAVIPKQGEYKLVVRNYRSTSGGRFTLYTKMAACVNAKPGNHLYEVDREFLKQNNQVFVSIQAEKGKYYGFLQSRTIFKDASVSPQFDKIIGPSGVPTVDQEEFQSLNANRVFLAKQSGTYLVRCPYFYGPPDQPITFGACLSEINVEKIGLDGTASVDLQSGQQKILQFDVKAGTAVRSKITRPASIYDKLNTPSSKGDSSSSGVIWIPLKTSDSTEGVRVYDREGTVTYVICNYGENPGTLKMENSTKFPELNLGSKISDRLGIGEAKVYSFSGSKMEIQRLMASSSQMEVTLDIIQDDLKRWTFADHAKHSPMTLLDFDAPHNLLLIVASEGRGGSGEYSLDYTKILPTSIKVGTTFSVSNPEGYSSVYEIALEKDSDYHLISKMTGAGVLISGPDGAELASNIITYSPTTIRFIRVKKSGIYRVRMSNAPNGTKVRFDKFTLPVID